jgi:hypothetical protein
MKFGQGSDLEGLMDRIVARMNIARFRKLLAEERDGRKWQTIRLLLEEEERKLAVQTKVHQGGGLVSLSHTAGGENGSARGSNWSAKLHSEAG